MLVTIQNIHFRLHCWQVVAVDPQDWISINGLDCKYIGVTKHTPHEIEISPKIITSDLGELILVVCCVYLPYFVPKAKRSGKPSQFWPSAQ